MGNVTRYPNGTFCWIDLGTTDRPAAAAFYAGLFGWQTEEVKSREAGFTICRLDARDITSIHGPDPKTGPGWSSSISVDDVEEATARARELGATVLEEPDDAPGIARISRITDPVGATVSLWQAKGHIGAGIVNENGTWTWTELVTTELDRAIGFYRDLLGWSMRELPAPSRRVAIELGQLLVGGAHVPTAGEPGTPRWDVSFRVADVDEAVRRTEVLGGSVVWPVTEIPIGRFAVIADPTGVASTVTEFEAEIRSVAQLA
jgi:uncharacterized protein